MYPMTESDIRAYGPMIINFLSEMDTEEDEDSEWDSEDEDEIVEAVITDFLPPGSSVLDCYTGSMCIDGQTERCQSVIFRPWGGELWTAMFCSAFGVSSLVQGPQYSSDWS